MIVGMMIVGGVLAFVVGGAYFLGVARRCAEPEVHRCRCPHCRQKVRDRGSWVKRELLCPRCRRRLTLPLPAQPQRKPAVTRQFSGW